jgi:uncharacterized protein (DUF2141 family)
MVIIYVSERSYIVCGCYNKKETAKNRANGLMINGCKSAGDQIMVSVYDSDKKWSDKTAWDNYIWND